MARDPGRRLTSGEQALADRMFGGAIDGSAVRLHRACWWPFQPNGVVMAPDGDIWFHPDDSVWCEDFAEAPLSAQGLLIHE
ncbi:MAG: vgr related protein, partial [Sphingomonas oligoaromativorans]